MENKGKYWAYGIAGALLIIFAVMAFAGTGKDRGAADERGNTGEGVADESGDTGESTADESGDAGEGAAGLETYLREQDIIMADMMRDMEDIPETGSADIDFLNGMIPHHESAVAMAESFLKNGGQNEKLKALAADVIEVQQKEIEQMKKMIERLEKSGVRDEKKEEEYLEEYRQMFASHEMDHGAQGHMTETSHSDQGHMQGHIQDHVQESAPGTGNTGTDRTGTDPAGAAGSTHTVDQAFAEGMILHHQMAVDMAESILRYTGDGEVKALAEAIVEAQKKEISEMQEIIE